MRLASLSIRNFRCVKSVDVTLEDYSCFLGRNDAGKSSILTAIYLLFEPGAHADSEDICGIETKDDDPAEIVAVLEGVPASHKYHRDGKATLRYDLRDDKRYAWGLTPKNPSLKLMKVGSFTKTLYSKAGFEGEQKQLIDEVIAKFPASGSRVQAEGWIAAYKLLEEKGMVEMSDGWDPISDANLTSLVIPVLLRADLKAAEELSDAGDTALGRVGGFLVRQAASQHEGLQKANENLKTQIEDVSKRSEDGKWEFEPLNRLEDILKNEIQAFDSAVIVDAKISPPKLRPLTFGIDVSVHDQFVKDISGLGHGLQRTAIFALLRIPQKMSMVPPTEPIPEAPLYLFLIEEPELYLYPQAEKRRMKELQALADLPQVQVFLATHSAFFVDMWRYRGISRVARPDRLTSTLQQWDGPDLSADQRDLLKATRYFHPTRSAMLFADLVILVEGATEQVMLPILAERLGIDVGEVEVVDCNGMGDLDLYARILQSFKMKYVVWPDSDAKDKIKKLKELINPAYGRLVIAKKDWEVMTGIGGSDDKPWRSYNHFVIQGKAPNDLTSKCIQAAFSWQDFDASKEDK